MLFKEILKQVIVDKIDKNFNKSAKNLQISIIQ